MGIEININLKTPSKRPFTWFFQQRVFLVFELLQFCPWFCSESLTCPAARADDKPPADHSVTSSFRGLADATLLQMPWNANTVEQHEAWRKTFRAKMHEVLGRFPERVPLKVKWTEKKEFDKFTRHKVYIQTERTYWCPCSIPSRKA